MLTLYGIFSLLILLILIWILIGNARQTYGRLGQSDSTSETILGLSMLFIFVILTAQCISKLPISISFTN